MMMKVVALSDILGKTERDKSIPLMENNLSGNLI